MERFQLENLYKINNLKDFRLRSTEDLLKVHGIDFEAVDGYKGLDEFNKRVYEKFIVNFYNGLGLDSRASLIPKGIYYVEEVECLAKEKTSDEHYLVVGGVVKVINKNGMKSVHRSWNDEDYNQLQSIESESKNYLRFEYEHQGNREWLHVMSENSWY